jgi:hypothetical protein
MAQNAKTGGGGGGAGGRKSKLATNPKKGARSIAPKKHSAVVSRSLQKVRPCRAALVLVSRSWSGVVPEQRGWQAGWPSRATQRGILSSLAPPSGAYQLGRAVHAVDLA